jgi:hypothetical protein
MGAIMLNGWRWKQYCAETPLELMQYVERDYPVFTHVDGKYLLFYKPQYVSFDASQSRLSYFLQFKEYNVSVSPVYSFNAFVDLTPCEVLPELDKDVFSDLPLQDLLIWLALGLIFLFGFHSGRR